MQKNSSGGKKLRLNIVAKFGQYIYNMSDKLGKMNVLIDRYLTLQFFSILCLDLMSRKCGRILVFCLAA